MKRFLGRCGVSQKRLYKNPHRLGQLIRSVPIGLFTRVAQITTSAASGMDFETIIEGIIQSGDSPTFGSLTLTLGANDLTYFQVVVVSPVGRCTAAYGRHGASGRNQRFIRAHSLSFEDLIADPERDAIRRRGSRGRCSRGAEIGTKGLNACSIGMWHNQLACASCPDTEGMHMKTDDQNASPERHQPEDVSPKRRRCGPRRREIMAPAGAKDESDRRIVDPTSGGAI